MIYRKPDLTIAAGVAFALLGAFLVFAYGRTVEANSGGAAMAQAFVARAQVPAGTRWEDALSSFRRQRIPVHLRPSNAVTSEDRLAGRTAVRSIAKGEVLTSAQFGAGAGASAGGLEIPPGQNAVAVSMPLPQGGARYVQPGALINVYATFKGEAFGPEGNSPTTKLILSNVQVLANHPHQQGAGNSTAEGAGGEILLTLALSPDLAEKLIYAKENGALWFGLMRPGDAPAGTSGRTPRSALR